MDAALFLQPCASRARVRASPTPRVWSQRLPDWIAAHEPSVPRKRDDYFETGSHSPPTKLWRRWRSERGLRNGAALGAEVRSRDRRDACASVALGRAIAGTLTRWSCGSPASGRICGEPSTTRASFSTCWSSAAAAVCWGFGPEFLLGSDLELVGRADLEKEGRS